MSLIKRITEYLRQCRESFSLGIRFGFFRTMHAVEAAKREQEEQAQSAVEPPPPPKPDHVIFIEALALVEERLAVAWMIEPSPIEDIHGWVRWYQNSWPNDDIDQYHLYRIGVKRGMNALVAQDEANARNTPTPREPALKLVDGKINPAWVRWYYTMHPHLIREMTQEWADQQFAEQEDVITEMLLPKAT